MKITGLRYVLVKGKLEYDGPLGEERLVRPIDIYPEFRAVGTNWPLGRDTTGPHYHLEHLFLFIDTDAGVSGTWAPSG